MKPIVIYHGNCADGYGAAWCFHNADPYGYEYCAGVYQNPPPNVEGRDVLLVDFSYKRDVVETMLETANSITLIDHHKTAWDDLFDLISYGKIVASYDVEQSGAALAWRYLHGARHRPRLIDHIEDRDLWRFALANGYEPARLRIPDSPADYPDTTRIASHPGGKHDLLALLIDWDRETCPVCRDQTDDAPLPWRDADREWRSPGRRCLSCGWAEGKVISPQQAAEIRREELND